MHRASRCRRAGEYSRVVPTATISFRNCRAPPCRRGRIRSINRRCPRRRSRHPAMDHGRCAENAAHWEEAQKLVRARTIDGCIAGARRDRTEADARLVVTSNVELDPSLCSRSSSTSAPAAAMEISTRAANVTCPSTRRSAPTGRPSSRLLLVSRRLPPVCYRLRISGTAPIAMADLQAQPIDGDGDGAPGGDFVLRFTVEMAQ